MAIFDDDIFDEGEGGVPLSEGTAKHGGRPVTLGEITMAEGADEQPADYRRPIAATRRTDGQPVVICDDGTAFVLACLEEPSGVQFEWMPLPSVPGTKNRPRRGERHHEAMTK